jgi:hypothetical protein
MSDAERINLPHGPVPPVLQRHGMPEGSDTEAESLWMRRCGHWLVRHWGADAVAAAG